MFKTFSVKSKKYRLALLMLPVVVPGLIISGFGILSISQQQKAKELKIEEKYAADLELIRKEMEEEIPDDLSRERILPDGSIKKEYGPFVYGYSVKIGKDGKPIIREFGNMKQNLDDESKKPVYLQEAREPLIDIIEETDQVKIIAELPGVEK